jgi:hypothetical protein
MPLPARGVGLVDSDRRLTPTQAQATLHALRDGLRDMQAHLDDTEAARRRRWPDDSTQRAIAARLRKDIAMRRAYIVAFRRWHRV